jgi:hypothetical protein
LVSLGDVKSHQLSEPVPDAGAWKCGLIKGFVAMRDVVAISIRGVKLIEDVVKVAERGGLSFLFLLGERRFA